jgi:hypothetical protein
LERRLAWCVDGLVMLDGKVLEMMAEEYHATATPEAP